MISITGVDFQTHELRHISPGFKNALAQWQIDAPHDKLYCVLHGKMEEVSLYVPETIAYMRDRVEEQQTICAGYEQSEREKVERDLEAGRTRRSCGRSHRD